MRQDEAQGAGTTFADFVAGTAWADVAAQESRSETLDPEFLRDRAGVGERPGRQRRVARAVAVQRCRDVMR